MTGEAELQLLRLQAHPQAKRISDRKFGNGYEGRLGTIERYPDRTAAKGRMCRCYPFDTEVCLRGWWKLRAWGNDLPRRAKFSRAMGGPNDDCCRGRQLRFSGRRTSHGLCFAIDESTLS